MPLEVEPDVAAVGLGQEPEAAPLLVGEEVDAVLARLAKVELELGLVADASRASPPACRRPAGPTPGSEPSRASVGIPCGHERLRPAAAQPGDEDEVVVVSSCCLQRLRKSQIPQWSHGHGYVSSLALERCEEPLAHAAEVGHELGNAERLALAAAELDVDALDGAPWIRPSCSE